MEGTEMKNLFLFLHMLVAKGIVIGNKTSVNILPS